MRRIRLSVGFGIGAALWLWAAQMGGTAAAEIAGAETGNDVQFGNETKSGKEAKAGDEQLLSVMPGQPQALDFTLPDLDGKPHRLRDYRGQVVVLNFWATWCPPCRHEIPSMQRAFEKLKADKVMILAVHVGGSVDKVWDFFADYEVTFPVLIDKHSKIAKAWPMQGLPTTFVIDPSGRIVYRAIGGRDWDAPQILKSLQALAQTRRRQ